MKDTTLEYSLRLKKRTGIRRIPYGREREVGSILLLYFRNILGRKNLLNLLMDIIIIIIPMYKKTAKLRMMK